MGRVILITGGSRSGKSAFAQRLAEQQAGGRLFLATCPIMDEEMEQRIRRHRKDREQCGWDTVEEPVAVRSRLEQAGRYQTVLIDCLTLWINNLMFDASQRDMTVDEDMIAGKALSLLAAARRHPGMVIMVTNEVGQGIVPEHQQARLYRDLVGRCNQCAAKAADEVYLVTCGIPIKIKEKTN